MKMRDDRSAVGKLADDHDVLAVPVPVLVMCSFGFLFFALLVINHAGRAALLARLMSRFLVLVLILLFFLVLIFFVVPAALSKDREAEWKTKASPAFLGVFY